MRWSNVNGDFFLGFSRVQGGIAFFLTAFIGPSTIAPDLANGALPLYFCRPFSRAEYVLGKLCSLFYLLSFITWVPGLILFGIEANLSGPGWMWEHRSLADRNLVELVDLYSDAFAARDGAVGLGEMEDRGRRADAGRMFFLSGLRRGHQRRDAHQHRVLHLPLAHSDHRCVRSYSEWMRGSTSRLQAPGWHCS